MNHAWTIAALAYVSFVLAIASGRSMFRHANSHFLLTTALALVFLASTVGCLTLTAILYTAHDDGFLAFLLYVSAAFITGAVPLGYWVDRIRNSPPRAVTESEVTTECQKCGYDLRGNVSGICPECGTPCKPAA